jgi:hypothetical protein
LAPNVRPCALRGWQIFSKPKFWIASSLLTFIRHHAHAGWTIALLWIVFAVQIFLSIRRVYRQGWFLSTLKFFTGGLVYLVVLLVALAATFSITLAIP